MKRAVQTLKASIIHAEVDPDFVQETEQAIAVLKERMEPQKTSGLSFSEALEAFRQGKTVEREQSNGWPYTITMDCKHAPSFADMIATDWSVVEDKE